MKAFATSTYVSRNLYRAAFIFADSSIHHITTGVQRQKDEVAPQAYIIDATEARPLPSCGNSLCQVDSTFNGGIRHHLQCPERGPGWC